LDEDGFRCALISLLSCWPLFSTRTIHRGIWHCSSAADILPAIRTLEGGKLSLIVSGAEEMGNFYTNYTLRGPSQQAVAAALTGRRARVTPARDGCVVAFDEASDSQDTTIIAELASKLSRELTCPVLAILNHDDDILWYQLFLNGVLADEYDSTPGYFNPVAPPSAPSGGDAKKLCDAFGAPNVDAVERVLRKSTFDADGYVFAFERHADLVNALAISNFAVGTAYASFDFDELPDGLSSGDILNVE
jgi:hypothetical protein